MFFFLVLRKIRNIKKTPKKVVSKNGIKKRNTPFERKFILLFFVLTFFLCSSFSLGVKCKNSRVVYAGLFGTLRLGLVGT